MKYLCPHQLMVVLKLTMQKKLLIDMRFNASKNPMKMLIVRDLCILKVSKCGSNWLATIWLTYVSIRIHNRRMKILVIKCFKVMKKYHFTNYFKLKFDMYFSI
jgi:hypothetical protein